VVVWFVATMWVVLMWMRLLLLQIELEHHKSLARVVA
jgi:hypothetical protein